jgi:hypothetical protein
VLEYVVGGKALEAPGGGEVEITRKFFGDDAIVERAIVTLASERALLLIGDPGTGKSWLSEHLAAAISGNSTLSIQGTAGTTEDQIKYSWNIARVIAEGPKPENMIPSPTMIAMRNGMLLRFEEITRCVPDVQDALVSILSDKSISVPELPDHKSHRCHARVQRHRHGQQPRSGRERAVGGAQTPIQLRAHSRGGGSEDRSRDRATPLGRARGRLWNPGEARGADSQSARHGVPSRVPARRCPRPRPSRSRSSRRSSRATSPTAR